MTIPLVCPACRTSNQSSIIELGGDPNAPFGCHNPGCSATYQHLTPTLPLLIPGDVTEVLAFDAFGEVVCSLSDKIGRLKRGDTRWRKLANAAVYLDAHYGPGAGFYTALLDWTFNLIDLKQTPIATAADLGCGPGRGALEVANRTGAEVLALDYNPHILRWGEAVIGNSQLNVPRLESALGFSVSVWDVSEFSDQRTGGRGRVRFVCADGVDPPVPGESFDLVTAINYLDVSRDAELSLAQCCAMVKPGGHFMMATPDVYGLSEPELWIADRPAHWCAYLERSGLETIAVQDGFEWTLRRTRRDSTHYVAYAILARKPTSAET